MHELPLRVLLVDPDPARRHRLGADETYSPLSVLRVASPEEVVPSRAPAFDVALLALTPGQDPVEAAALLARHLPDVPIVTVDGVEGVDPLALLERGVQEHIPRECVGCPQARVLPALRWAVERGRLLRRIDAIQEESAHRSLHDPLTALPNRKLFGDRLGHILAQAQRRERSFAVMFVDLDRFKQVNDTLGHGYGDRLLVEIALRLNACLRGSDTCARWGGDEFAIVLEGVSSRADATRVATKALKAIARPLHVGGRELFTSASIGISLFPDDGADVGTLVRHADMAMYRAKARGGNGFRFFQARMDEEAHERLELEHALVATLKRGELGIAYQPQIDLASGELVGFEALVRWKHPQLGMVPPRRFIPLAEETGVIVELGEWVLRTACAQSVEWRRTGRATCPIAVNVSARQFQQPDFAELVQAILDETGAGPGLLELELTESAVMKDPRRAAELLRDLQEMGVETALDDFGTGYSSLGLLGRLPFARLKIDRSFVSKVLRDRKAAAITRAIIDMARSLEMRSIAEGVEKSGQLEFLREHGCDEVQGYLIGRPVPAAQALGSV